MKNYNQFCLKLTENNKIFESLNVEDNDKNYFITIFNSIYENHLTNYEKNLLNDINILNENWFTELKDKAERGVLKIKSKAGELLTAVAQKAKDILDFAKLIATQIKDSVAEMLKNSISFFKNKLIPTDDLLNLITDYINKKKDLKGLISKCGETIKFILTELPVKLFNKLVNFFKNIFNKGTNEGFNYFCNDFLNEENDEDEKKSFLQRLGEKINSIPPFSWIPKIEEILKKGISKIRDFIEQFFVWIDKEDVSEAIDLSRKVGSTKFSRFSKSLLFLFDILEIYIIYKFNEKLGDKLNQFKEAMKSGNIENFKTQIQNNTLEVLYQKIGINPNDIVSSIKGIAEKIPYISDILAILKNLSLCIGIYQQIQPALEKIK